MVPSGWELKELQFLCKKIAVGLAISVTPFMRASGAKLIRNQNIKRNYFNSNSVVYIDEVFADSNKSKRVRHGDVVAVRTGSNIGEACVVPEEFEGALTFTTLIARPNPDFLDSFYLSTHINSDRGVAEVNRLCAGGGKPNLNSGELKRYRLLTPPLPEQKKIAQILSTWDKAITTTEQLLANSQQQKKALMQQLLTGKKRLLDKNGVRFSGEWKKFPLNKIAEVIVSPVDKKSKPDEIPVELCNYTDVYYNHLITRSIDFMKATASKSEIEKYTLQKDDVIITKDSETPGDIAVPALVSEDLKGVVCGYHLTIIRPFIECVNGAFLNYLFSMQKTRYYFFTLATGATRFGLSVKGINHAYFKIPSTKEQRRIATVLSTADQEITALQQKLNALKQEKKALMQQLLTGKRRVKVN